MANFKEYKAALRAHVATLFTNNNVLYHSTVGGDELWQWFLDALPAELRAEYTCNACRSFIKHFGGLVAIGADNKTRSIWSFITEDEFNQVNFTLNEVVLAGQVRDVFVPSVEQSTLLPNHAGLMLGLDKNVAQVPGADGTMNATVEWHHLSFPLSNTYFFPRNPAPEAERGKYRDHANVLKRSLEEISRESIQLVKDLIAQNSLYRGAENLHAITEFEKVQFAYAHAPAELRTNLCWRAATSGLPESVLRFRNTSIGTLLTDLTEGMMGVDAAVRAFEAKVAPANYKRPNAVVTPKMVAEAEKEMEALGLTSALQRRFAVPEDLSVANALFVNRNLVKNNRFIGGGSAFADLADSLVTVANPKQFSKVETVTLENLVKNILPTAASIDLLVENHHKPQFMSLIAPVDPNAGHLFKWPNNFSWNYADALADGIKERVKAAGGNIIADVRATLQWNEDGQSIVDLDLHAIEPGGTRIFYGSGYRGQGPAAARTPQSGNLDVDMQSPSHVGIENITWTNAHLMKKGTIRLEVNNYNGRRNNGCRIQIEVLGETFEFSYDKHFLHTIHVADIVNTGNGFEVVPAKGMTGGGSTVKQQPIWGVQTYSFVPVQAVTYSPNYWGEDWSGTGNRHVFFLLQGVKSEGLVRGFFNEFLDSRLDKHKRVFETLAGKLAVEPAEHELSGVGFATTGTHEFNLRVKSQSGLERVIKVIA